MRALLFIKFDLVAQLVEQPEEGMSLVRAQPWPVLVWMAHLKQHKWYSEFYAKILSAPNFLIDVLRGLGEGRGNYVSAIYLAC